MGWDGHGQDYAGRMIREALIINDNAWWKSRGGDRSDAVPKLWYKIWSVPPHHCFFAYNYMYIVCTYIHIIPTHTGLMIICTCVAGFDAALQVFVRVASFLTSIKPM